MKEGFFKVGQTGGSYVVATFFNPETGESFTKCVRDYDYADCSRDDDELYDMPIDETARVAYMHSMGVIFKGDTVEVVKGRKVKIGTVGVVKEIKPYFDMYGRWVADYAYFEDGQRTNVKNCKLVA